MNVQATLPDDYVGAWRRVSVREGNKAAHETHRTIWLQGRRWFADLRLPHDPQLQVRCFAGYAQFETGRILWAHELDNIQRSTQDSAVVERRDNTLIERGENLPDGTHIDYEEIYELVSARSAPILMVAFLRTDGTLGGLLAQIGMHRIVMVDSRQDGRTLDAGYWMSVRDRWRLQFSFGDHRALPKIPDRIDPASLTAWVKEGNGLKGQRWQVVEG